MRIGGFLSLAILAVPGITYAQSVYHGAPDWVSTDTPVSTGGALVDLDRDGWLDFVVANGNDMVQQELTVYYNQGNGTFPATPDWLSDDTEYNGHISIADVNGDGWIDVAVGLTMQDPGTPTARVYLNNDGALSALSDWETPNELAAFHVAFGDVNGDGRPDLAVGTGWPYSKAHVWPNHVYLNVNGTLEANPSWVSNDTWDFGDIFFCDVNGDGWLDLVGVGEDTHTWVYLNDTGSLATTATWHTTDNEGQFAVMGTYGDVNDDGWLDLFTADNIQLFAGTGRFRRYDGLPGGLFTTTPTWSYYEGYGSAVALADVDADGDLDLATGGWWDRTRYFLNNGGSFPASPSWSSTGTSVVETLVFGDVNNDALRYPVETFSGPGVAGRHLVQLSRQPIDRIEAVLVDGVLLAPHQFTFDAVHGWVSVGPAPAASVSVHYIYSLKPDLAVTNWDATIGNYLYYNLNSARRFGDWDVDGGVALDDFASFPACLSGPGSPATVACAAVFDADLDADVDLVDFARLQEAFAVGRARF